MEDKEPGDEYRSLPYNPSFTVFIYIHFASAI